MEELVFREATRQDLPRIISLIADDPLGQARETQTSQAGGQQVCDVYETAFAALENDPNQVMAIAELDGDVVGYMQISLIPGLSRQGAWRGQLESVRVSSAFRGRGIGTAFFKWAIALCRERNCQLVQLTTDRQREDALRFYEQLGFTHSHNGMKLIF